MQSIHHSHVTVRLVIPQDGIGIYTNIIKAYCGINPPNG